MDLTLTPTEWALAIARASAALAALWFALSYARVRWEDSAEGQNVMALTLCLLVVSLTGAVRIVTPAYAWIDIITASAWFAVAGVIVWRHRLRRRADRDWDDQHP